MILPKLYQIKSQGARHSIIINIIKVLKSISPNDYPNVVAQFENDNSKVNLIDMVICNAYSGLSTPKSVLEILDSIEVTID